MERLRRQKEASQQQKNPKEQRIPPLPDEDEDDDEGYEVDEEDEVKEEKPKKSESVKNDDLTEAITKKVAQYQDNGIFRFEFMQVLMSIDESLKKLVK